MSPESEAKLIFLGVSFTIFFLLVWLIENRELKKRMVVTK
jgi:hypothetical protein